MGIDVHVGLRGVSLNGAVLVLCGAARGLCGCVTPRGR